MRVALVGAAGQLGTALAATAACRLDRPARRTRKLKFAMHASVDAALSAAAADCVINAAAYNFVDRAEDEPELAHAVNAIGPQNLARWCARHNARAGARQHRLRLLRTSLATALRTSRPTPRRLPASMPAASWPAKSLCGPSVLRTSSCARAGFMAAPQTAGKGNFVRTMLRMASEGRPLKVVDDQHCTPSFAADIAAAIWRLLPTSQFGLYHATNSGQTTWHGFACEIVRAAGFNTQVAAIPSRDFPQKAKRPAYSVLDCSKLAATIGGGLPTWQNALGRYVPQIVSEFPRPP